MNETALTRVRQYGELFTPSYHGQLISVKLPNFEISIFGMPNTEISRFDIENIEISGFDIRSSNIDISIFGNSPVNI